MSKMNLSSLRIGVLMGGTSAEREISLRTGNAVLSSLKKQGLKAMPIDAEITLPTALMANEINCAFIALHGRHGEDGTVQGLLEILHIPYTGSGVLASSLAIDKVMTKHLLRQFDIPTPGGDVFVAGTDAEAFAGQFDTFPCVVKPSREGSTIGVSVVLNKAELVTALGTAAALDRQVLVEPFFRGRELTVSVVNGQALPVIEIVPKSGFYDYEAKYTQGQTEYRLPAPISDELTKQVQAASVKACTLIGCRGAARVDFLANDDDWTCLEVNTIPGMTETSLLPKAADAAGMNFDQLCLSLLKDAGLDK